MNSKIGNDFSFVENLPTKVYHSALFSLALNTH